MDKSGLKNRISFELAQIRMIIARDGRIFAPSSEGRLIQISKKDGVLSPDSVLGAIAEGETLSSPGGASFEAAKKLLESYRRFALGRGAGDPFDQQKESDLSGEVFGENALPSDLPSQITPDLVLSRGAGVLELSRISAVKPRQLLSMVTEAVESMLCSPSAVRQDMGELLYARYIKPEYGEKPTEFYMALFRCSRATWFRLQNQAISGLAIWLFGPFPAE